MSQTGGSKHVRSDGAIGNVKNRWESVAPAIVCAWAELARVSLNRGDTRDASREACGMQERRAGTCQVLHGEEHAVFRRGGTHQQRLRLPFTRLEGNA